MKVIFLDVDGVLNTIYSQSILHICKKKARWIKNLCRETGAVIVVSSTWRLHEHAYEKLKNEFGELIIGSTPKINSDRGTQIKMWLDENNVTSYVIVDDDGDMLEEQLPRFVQTFPEHGLCKTAVYRMKYILEHGNRYYRDTELGQT